MHALFGFRWGLIRGALGRITVVRSMRGNERGGLARENRATIWIDGWESKCFAATD
jgi:hypothetical protein